MRLSVNFQKYCYFKKSRIISFIFLLGFILLVFNQGLHCPLKQNLARDLKSVEGEHHIQEKENSSRISPTKPSLAKVPQVLKKTQNTDNNIYILTEGFWWMRDLEMAAKKNGPVQQCEYTNCVVFTSKSYLPLAHIVLYDGWGGKPPDWLCNDTTDAANHTVKLFYIMESPIRTNSSYWEIFNGCFQATATYRKESDVYFPYGRIQKKGKKSVYKVTDRERKGKVAWMVSHCVTQNSPRHEYVQELRKFIQVDIFGDCGNFTCSRRSLNQCMRSLEKNYYFYLAFENSMCDQYITEKVWRTLKYELVPVVMGGSNYTTILPSNSFIDTADYPNPKDLANYLNKVASSKSLYDSYFAWKDSAYVTIPEIFCETCKFANTHDLAALAKRDVLQDINERWSAKKHCISPKRT